MYQNSAFTVVQISTTTLLQGVEGIINRFVNLKKMSKMSKMWSTLWSEQGQETMLKRNQDSSSNRNELGMIFIFKILNHRFIL